MTHNNNSSLGLSEAIEWAEQLAGALEAVPIEGAVMVRGAGSVHLRTLIATARSRQSGEGDLVRAVMPVVEHMVKTCGGSMEDGWHEACASRLLDALRASPPSPALDREGVAKAIQTETTRQYTSEEEDEPAPGRIWLEGYFDCGKIADQILSMVKR